MRTFGPRRRRRRGRRRWCRRRRRRRRRRDIGRRRRRRIVVGRVTSAVASRGDDALDGERFGLVLPVQRVHMVAHRSGRREGRAAGAADGGVVHRRRRRQRLFGADRRRRPVRRRHDDHTIVVPVRRKCRRPLETDRQRPQRRRTGIKVTGAGGGRRRRPAERSLQQRPVGGRKFEPLAAPQERSVLEHVQGVGVQGPVSALARLVRSPGNLHETVVERQVVSQRVLPPETSGVLVYNVQCECV